MGYKASSINRGLAQNEEGIIFFANEDGLLRYNGFEWDLISLPGNVPLIDVCVFENKLYGITWNKFGHFEEDSYGDLHFRDLTNNAFSDENFSNIIHGRDRLLIKGRDRILQYRETDNEPVPLNMRIVNEGSLDIRNIDPLSIFEINGLIYCQNSDYGFYKYSPEGWTLFWSPQLLHDELVEIVTPYNYRRSNSLIPDGSLVFAKHQIFKVLNGSLILFSTEIDDIIRQNPINDASFFSTESIMISTEGAGIIQLDNQGKIKNHLYRGNGLTSSFVKKIYLSEFDNNLWLINNHGISLLHMSLPVKMAVNEDISFEMGEIHDAEVVNGQIISATDNGLFSFSDKFIQIPNVNGKVNFIKKIDGQIFIGQDKKTVITEENGEIHQSETGGNFLKKLKFKGEDVLFQGDGKNLCYYSKTAENKWKFNGIIGDFEDEINGLEMDNKGSLWVSFAHNGVALCKITNDFQGFSSVMVFPVISEDSIPSSVNIFKFGGQIFFSRRNKLYTYDSDKESFKEEENIIGQHSGRISIKNINTIDDTNYWVTLDDSYLLVNEEDLGNILFTVPFSIFSFSKPVSGSDLIVKDKEVFIPLEEGIGYIDIDGIKKVESKAKLSLNQIAATDNEGKLIRLPITGKVKTDLSNIKVKVNYPDYNRIPHKFLFVLKRGSNSIERITTEPEIEFKDLGAGNYNLTCTVADISGQPLDSLIFNFVINSPWPLRWWAWILYFIILLTIIFLVSKMATKWQIKVKLETLKNEKLKRDAMIRDQSLIIASQEKRLVNKNLSAKSEELSRFILDADMRQKITDEMGKTLKHRRERGKGVAQAEKILREISTANNDGRLFWDILYKNFSIINESYFEDLKTQYPILTDTDLKLCGLLRMGLSTKEISIFTDLSKRGVETARYRLRKKFALSADISLNDFLASQNFEKS